MAESYASSSTQAGQTARPPTVRSHDVAIRTLGCKVNQVESENIAAALLGGGCHMAAEEGAAVVIINTCTVTAEADRKARKAVRHALAANSESIVLVTGCLASVDPASLEALGERVVTVPDKAAVTTRVAELLGLQDVQDRFVAEFPLRSGEAYHTRAMLRVQDGCDAFCSYCIVPNARGAPRSVGLSAVVDEARRLVESGSRELVLTGINLGRYAESGTSLAELVKAVDDVGPAKLRLSSIEPMHLTDELLSVLAESRSVCPHLHVPLQSGSDSVLAAMHRKYTVDEYASRIAAARSALGQIAVTTDVMVGFPKESESDFERTLDAVESIGFSKLHVFRYSERPGTAAAQMEESVPSAVRSERASRLRQVGESLSIRYLDSRVGGSAALLVESVDSDSQARGTTGDYIKARCASHESSVGEILQVRLVERVGGEMLAEPVQEA